MKAWEFQEYTASSFDDPDLAAYGRVGWELVSVMPWPRPTIDGELRYTFFMQREYMGDRLKSEPREFWIGDPDNYDTMVPLYIGGSGKSLHGYIKVREVIE